MDLKDILEVLERMHIPTAGLTSDSLLGGNLGMDSQEIVEFMVNLEEHYGDLVSSSTVTKDFSIQDVINIVQ